MLTLSATGVLLYIGHGGIWVTVHYTAALVVLTYIVAHVVLHYCYGGVAQLLRLFRPQALRRFPGMSRHPLALATALGAIVLVAPSASISAHATALSWPRAPPCRSWTARWTIRSGRMRPCFHPNTARLEPGRNR